MTTCTQRFPIGMRGIVGRQAPGLPFASSSGAGSPARGHAGEELGVALGGVGVEAFPGIIENPGISFLHRAGGFAPQNPPLAVCQEEATW